MKLNAETKAEIEQEILKLTEAEALLWGELVITEARLEPLKKTMESKRNEWCGVRKQIDSLTLLIEKGKATS